jgi:hypothetical protein
MLCAKRLRACFCAPVAAPKWWYAATVIEVSFTALTAALA